MEEIPIDPAAEQQQGDGQEQSRQAVQSPRAAQRPRHAFGLVGRLRYPWAARMIPL